MQETPPVYCLLHHSGAFENKHHRRNKDPLVPDCHCWLPTCKLQNTSVFHASQTHDKHLNVSLRGGDGINKHQYGYTWTGTTYIACLPSQAYSHFLTPLPVLCQSQLTSATDATACPVEPSDPWSSHSAQQQQKMSQESSAQPLDI